MNTNKITVRPDRLYCPLEPLAVGALSSAVAIIGGDIPDDIESMVLSIEYTDETSGETAYYKAAATEQADGTWRAYIAPAYFPAASTSLKYHVIGTDSSGNPRWLGTGLLRILENPANGSAEVPDVLPRNLYAYNAKTGLYYKVIAEANEDGEITIAVDQEGVNL